MINGPVGRDGTADAAVNRARLAVAGSQGTMESCFEGVIVDNVLGRHVHRGGGILGDGDGVLGEEPLQVCWSRKGECMACQPEGDCSNANDVHLKRRSLPKALLFRIVYCLMAALSWQLERGSLGDFISVYNHVWTTL